MKVHPVSFYVRMKELTKEKKRKHREINMVGGNLWRDILVYSVPLMFSNILQVLFNMSDVAVVGKFAGPIALGAVGSTTILVTLTTGINLGIASGVNAVTALFLGGKKHDQVRRTVHTAFLVCLMAGLFITAAGLLFAKPVLAMMNTKPELIDGAVIYLQVYLLGSPALALYNFGNAVLSAAGDTKRPLAYLSLAGVINVVLNLVFVIVFHMDVVGVALASIIAQYISAILILRYLMGCNEIYHLELKKVKFHKDVASRILIIGIPSAIQYSLFAIANLFVQTAVNYFDHVVVEGNSAASNADALVYDMMAAFYTACTSFIAQNLGAGKKKRIIDTYWITMAYSFGMGAILSVGLLLFRSQFLGLFTSDPKVIEYGMVRITIMGFCYAFSAFMDNALAAARGIGKSIAPTIIAVMGSVVFRIIWIYTIFAYFHTLMSLYLLYICAWTVTAIAGNIYFLREYKRLPANTVS